MLRREGQTGVEFPSKGICCGQYGTVMSLRCGPIERAHSGPAWFPQTKGALPMQNDTFPKLALLTLGLLTGCDWSVKSGRGFVFPEGDVARGRAAFAELKCVECHRVDGVAGLPAPTASLEKVVVLGGKVTRLKTYGELVTSIIHPTNTLSEKLPNRGIYLEEGKPSPMRVVNDTMTVRQLLDIVTFLQPQYRGIEPQSAGYKIP